MSIYWVQEHTNAHVVAVCLEIPWNRPDSDVAGYTPEGRQLGQAIERYLKVTKE